MMTIHVMPVNDLIEHIEHEWCPCNPRIEEDGQIIVHNAADNREIVEQANDLIK